MFNICTFEANIISVERIKKFESDYSQENKSETNMPLRDSWPKTGLIEIEGLNVEYGDDSKEKRTSALKDINCKIEPGEKVKLPFCSINFFLSVTICAFKDWNCWRIR